MRKSNHRRLKTKHLNRNITKPVFLFAIILVLSLMSLVIYKVFTVDGFAFVNKAENGDAEIIVFDPVANTSKSFVVAGNTVLSSSRSLGEYRLDNLWILGRKEGYGGKLISESISKNFLIPIYYWKDENKTNLDIFKLIRAKIILSSGSIEKKDIQLNNLSNSTLVNFVNTEISDSGVEVEIEDLTGTVSISNDVAKILEILGTKITSFSKGYEKDLDCEVLGTSKKLVEVIATYLGCKETVKQDLKTDIVVRLGGQFADRF
jgi:hypothetical protein